MEIGETYDMPADKFSTLKPEVKYASKGEKVTVKSVFGEVVIVERSDLYRFPIKTKELTGEEEIKQVEYKQAVSKQKKKSNSSAKLF